jgi:biopolymer transport protein ExbD
MSKFDGGKKKRVGPSISTASLPDIVFMLLFFFMVATKSKDNEASVMVKLPNASETGKLEDKTPTAYIQLGIPIQSLQKVYGDKTTIQLNDAIKSKKDIRMFVNEKRATIKANYSEVDPQIGVSKAKKMVVCLKVDKKTKLGIVSEVKEELRDASALKINYIVNEVK